MDENIMENHLKTNGIYAWVRIPMYSGWCFGSTISLPYIKVVDNGYCKKMKQIKNRLSEEIPKSLFYAFT